MVNCWKLTKKILHLSTAKQPVIETQKYLNTRAALYRNNKSSFLRGFAAPFHDQSHLSCHWLPDCLFPARRFAACGDSLFVSLGHPLQVLHLRHCHILSPADLYDHISERLTSWPGMKGITVMLRIHPGAEKLEKHQRVKRSVNLSGALILEAIVCSLFLLFRQVVSSSYSLNCRFCLIARSSSRTTSTKQIQAQLRNCTAAKCRSALKESADSWGTISPSQKWKNVCYNLLE